MLQIINMFWIVVVFWLVIEIINNRLNRNKKIISLGNEVNNDKKAHFRFYID